MELQFISDIHENYIDVPVVSDNIALLGDIGDPFTKGYDAFLGSLSKKFKRVFVVAGNHEYYYRTMKDVEDQIQKVCSNYLNVYFLNNKSVEINGVLVVGSTLWSKIDLLTAYRTNDFKCIRTSKKKFLDVPAYLDLHKKACAFIEHEVSKGMPTIVLTHFAPIYEMNGAFINSPLRSAYSSDLSYIQGNIKAWISGHTHQNLLLEKNGVYYASNCMGYSKFGAKDFSPTKRLKL